MVAEQFDMNLYEERRIPMKKEIELLPRFSNTLWNEHTIVCARSVELHPIKENASPPGGVANWLEPPLADDRLCCQAI